MSSQTNVHRRPDPGSDLCTTSTDRKLRLLATCPDQKGLVAVISSFFERHRGSILRIDQYLQPGGEGRFFLRMEIYKRGFDLGPEEFDREFVSLAREYDLDWRLSYSGMPKRMDVSKYDHCLIDLLWRRNAGKLEAEIPLVISNHPDLAPLAEVYSIPSHHLPVTKETRAEQKAEILGLLAEHEIDFVVLARYMQILSPGVVAAYPGRIINTHHSFLPAFAGVNPYHRAYKRGVKIIGATGHYVTEDLDAGPIICQDVSHVTHWDTAEDMVRNRPRRGAARSRQGRSLAPRRPGARGRRPQDSLYITSPPTE